MFTKFHSYNFVYLSDWMIKTKCYGQKRETFQHKSYTPEYTIENCENLKTKITCYNG